LPACLRTFNVERRTLSMRVLITGGAGFIGSHTAEALIDQGCEIAIVDDLNDFYDPAIKQRNLELIKQRSDAAFFCCDICDRERLEKIFSDFKPRSVIHLAARAGVRPSLKDPLLYQEVNVNGTINLLELSCRHEVENFVFASSSSVYGLNSKVPFSESDPVDKPISPYAITKRAGELLCFNYSHLYGLPATCLRFFTVYGPRQRPEMAIHKFARQIIAGQPIEIYGDGSSSRDYTYIADIVDGVISAFNHRAPFAIYNLGNSDCVEMWRLIQLLEESLGRKAKINWLPEQPGDVPITYADLTAASRDLGYRPRIKIEEGIKLFAQWLQGERTLGVSQV